MINRAVNSTKYKRVFKLMNSWQGDTLSDAFLEKFCVNMMAWSDQPEAHTLTQYLRLQGVPERIFWQWHNRYPEIQNTYWYAMSNIGSRRQAILEKHNPERIADTLSAYCSVWAACEERRARLKEPQASSLVDLACLIPDLPNKKLNGKTDGTDYIVVIQAAIA